MEAENTWNCVWKHPWKSSWEREKSKGYLG